MKKPLQTRILRSECTKLEARKKSALLCFSIDSCRRCIINFKIKYIPSCRAAFYLDGKWKIITSFVGSLVLTGILAKIPLQLEHLYRIIIWRYVPKLKKRILILFRNCDLHYYKFSTSFCSIHSSKVSLCCSSYCRFQWKLSKNRVTSTCSEPVSSSKFSLEFDFKYVSATVHKA